MWPRVAQNLCSSPGTLFLASEVSSVEAIVFAILSLALLVYFIVREARRRTHKPQAVLLAEEQFRAKHPDWKITDYNVVNISSAQADKDEFIVELFIRGLAWVAHPVSTVSGVCT